MTTTDETNEIKKCTCHPGFTYALCPYCREEKVKREIEEILKSCPNCQNLQARCEALAAENRELKALVGEAVEIVKDYPKRIISTGPEANPDGGWGAEFSCCNWCGESADKPADVKHTIDCLAVKAAALHPRLEKAGKGEV